MAYILNGFFDSDRGIWFQIGEQFYRLNLKKSVYGTALDSLSKKYRCMVRGEDWQVLINMELV
jgi:hypothetical protein